ncbi:large ribosomal subunit protein eL42-like [Pleurodeles waltl]|uniref:large ribosomal subunit protein eL42-like n=1 Tax=Pleurodeles waltl TaxID=8319 RepID=UPI0037096587
MVNVQKTCKTCKNWGKHQPHKVAQYSKGKGRYYRRKRGYGGQTKPSFHKKGKTMKTILLRLECVESNSRSRGYLKKYKHFELGRRKGQVIKF